MYKKFEHFIWTVSAVEVKTQSTILTKYKLEKKLFYILGKRKTIKWIINYYFSDLSEKDLIAIELFNKPYNQFFLVLPSLNKMKAPSLFYLNITNIL